jgi:hypothetical protein
MADGRAFSLIVGVPVMAGRLGALVPVLSMQLMATFASEGAAEER